ncbi:chemotaxis protein CheB [Spirosoma sp.]|uniref:chemotaxis protein CheB n=1 Tax=Spirosoma sp. TaxID=1899569 RepID=UPI0026276F7C|nr:chemotaxis protein CheB [Spirosoma sp.]MCX6212904.1 chemotaxis protein CheB [Spirosoma sp.]
MTKRDIVVIGASAGGVYALRELVAGLPHALPATIFIVQHIAADAPSYLPRILNYAGNIIVIQPVDGEPIQRGHIYVAPPDHHLLIENETMLVKRGPKENRFRPSIDALFRSAAYCYGPRVIGVVLTGLLNDGTSGMWTVKRLGGVSVIQEPEEALYPSMPESVRENVVVDHSVPISEMAALLTKLTQETVNERPILAQKDQLRLEKEVKIAEEENTFNMSILEEGDLSPLACPECHGVMTSIQEGTLLRYRCHTGHGYTASSLLSGLKRSIEESLWNAIRALEETVMLLDKAAQVLEEGGNVRAAQEYRAQISEAEEKIRQLRPLVFAG